jgi:hypothetical protein
MLVAFALRALIPAGFMPASDRPFAIEICWEGLPPGLITHGDPPHAGSMDMDSMDMGSMSPDSTSHRAPLQGAHHSGSPSHSEHCVFGTACSAGPTPHVPLPRDSSSAHPPRAAAFVAAAVAVRLVHLPQPRAPPGRLS